MNHLSLTPKTNEVFNIIVQLVEEKGTWPTIRQIASACNFRSTNTASYHLDRIKRVGLIEKDDNGRADFYKLNLSGMCNK